MTPMPVVQHMNLDIAPRVHISTVKNFAQIGRLPSVSLVGHPESYPMRFPVPDRFISWDVAFDQYAPSFAESESCVEVPSSSKSYEGPVSNDPGTQLPRNPVGRTGLIGRGSLWSYGANQAADAVVLRGPQTNGDYEILLIEREDGSLAFPGGFLNPGEDPKNAMLRELAEEALLFDGEIGDRLRARATLLYQGYADDPRNTDNAWIETSAYLIHVTDGESRRLELSPRDDAHGVRWLPLSRETREALYASHPQLATLALQTVKRTEAQLSPYRSPEIRSLAELTQRGLKRIAIFGGSFDPIHKGHIEVAEAMLCAHDLDAVVFMPAKQNPLKATSPFYTDEARMRQITAAISRLPGMFVLPLELEREGTSPSYLLDSLNELTEQAPEAELFFIHGADTLEELHRWKEIEKCMSLATFLPARRDDVRREDVPRLAMNLNEEAKAHLFRAYVDVETTKLSSTEIRQRRN